MAGKNWIRSKIGKPARSRRRMKSRLVERKPGSRRGPAAEPDHDPHHGWRLSSVPWPAVLVAIAVALPVLRALGVVEWSWLVTLAPFTVAGVVFTAFVVGMAFKPQLDMLLSVIGVARGGLAAHTAPPDQLEAPLAAADAGEGILAEHPELLAALCHGFRLGRLQPTVLGRPVTDPWGVYAAALLASSFELEQVKILARKHMQRFMASGRRTLGRAPSEADVMKQAMLAFRNCAAKFEAGRGNPDCPFEHVVVVFGARSPNRDAHLKSVAPKVRALLERQYPQLATDRLGDGSQVRYGEWQKQAAQDRRQLARLRREHERLRHRLDELSAELAEARAREEAVRASVQTARQEARAASRAEQQKAVQELRDAMEQGRLEYTRNVQRVEAEKERLLATIALLSAERDALEVALFSDDDDEAASGASGAIAEADVAGLRVLLVGGDQGHMPAIREYVEHYGVQLLHADGSGAAELIGSVHVVVLWTRFMSHPTYHTLKRECRARDVPHGYWARTSPASLIALIADVRRGVRAGAPAELEA